MHDALMTISWPLIWAKLSEDMMQMPSSSLLSFRHDWVKLSEEIIKFGIWEGISTVGIAVIIKLWDSDRSDGIGTLKIASSTFSMNTFVGVYKGRVSDASKQVRRRENTNIELDFINIIKIICSN
jgi:hypothetical protein